MFYTCGPNEAMVVSGKMLAFIFKFTIKRLYRSVYTLVIFDSSHSRWTICTPNCSEHPDKRDSFVDVILP